MSRVRQMTNVGVDIGKEPGRVQKTYELREVSVDSLSESPNFAAVVAAFSGFRLLRPILLVSAFAGGPQDADGVALFAVTLNWIAASMGLAGAILVSLPLRDFFKHHGASPWLTWRLEPAALFAFIVAVMLDLLHQLLAAVSWKYFWSTGVEPEHGDNGMLSFILVFLHIIGLIGLLGMVAAYGRCFRASWRKFQNGPPSGYGDDHLKSSIRVDIEEGSNAESTPTVHVRTASAPKKDPTVIGGPRQAATAGQSKSAPRVSEGPPASSSVGPTNSSPSSPRAWFWHDAEWVPVRIMRSSADGIVVVRLPGGSTARTIQFLLRPRVDLDEQPPSDPPSGGGEGTSKASATKEQSRKEEQKRRPTWGATDHASSDHAKNGLPKRPTSAPPVPTQPPDDSEGAKWSIERLASLRKELQALDGKPASERRTKLRVLQRELHPDKQPPELRAYAQPLFMLVQREWELHEAAAKATANTTN